MADMLRVRGVPAPRRVFLAVPTNRGVSPETTQALFASAVLLDRLGYGVDLAIERGNCHVDDARNSLVREFLASECDELVFIDDDVGFEAGTLAKLLTYDRDVVGGVYPKKEDVENFPVYVEPGTILQADDDGLVEVHGLPTGFMKIKRHVLETLAKDAVCFVGSDGRDYHVVFERTVTDGKRWSGDYAFCRKWLAKGGKLYTDPAMAFTHVGGKTWAGELGAFWRRVHGVNDLIVTECLAAIREGDRSDAVLDRLCEAWGNQWAAKPALLRAIADNAHGRVIECGCGLSTLVMAAMGCEVTAIEHDPAYASHTIAMLQRHDLQAEVKVCPLAGDWYDFTGGMCDTLLIDGPPRNLSDRNAALGRITARLVIWDDYESGLENPTVTSGVAVQEA